MGSWVERAFQRLLLMRAALFAAWAIYDPLHASRPSKRTLGLRLELGFQADPLAISSSLFVLGGFATLQLKIRSATMLREERDAAAEMLRKAEVLHLAGKLTAEEVEQAAATAQGAADEYEQARRIVALGNALLRIPDPTPPPATLQQREKRRRLQEKRARDDAIDQASQPSPLSGEQGDANAGSRSFTRAPAEPSNLLPSGSSRITLKDAAIGVAFILQICWFLVWLTDPMGMPNPVLKAALTSGGEYVDRMEARRVAESVDSSEAPPLCATVRMGEPGGGCSSSPPSR